MSDWSYKLYKITEIINDTIPSYRIDIFPELYNEALLKTTKLTLKENEDVMKKLSLKQIKVTLTIRTYAY